MKKLTEGMRGGDLEDLILPMISVDEFESKIDDEALVIGFFVQEQNAADDLNRFIQRSPVELIDTEVSPAPDQHGYYMVFVELLKNAELAQNVSDILEEVSPLANVKNWKMQVRGHDGLLPFSVDDFAKCIKNDKPKKDSVKESILTYLTPSDLKNAKVWGDNVVLESATGRYAYKLVGYGQYDEVLVEHGLNEKPISLNLMEVARCNQLAGLLGDGWLVHRIGDCDVLQRLDTGLALILR